jgi:hypothetical protein
MAAMKFAKNRIRKQTERAVGIAHWPVTIVSLLFCYIFSVVLHRGLSREDYRLSCLFASLHHHYHYFECTSPG